MKKKVSIIIAAYNVADYIDKAISSCVKQTYNNIEVIVINDGSQDNILEKVGEFICSDSQIRVVTTDNQGLSVARNTGIEMATGDYIMFLDGDDWLDSSIVELCMETMSQELDVVYFNAVDCTDDQGEITAYQKQMRYFVDPQIVTGDDILKKAMNYPIRHEAWRGCYSKSFLDRYQIRFIPGVYYEDNSFWLDAMLAAKKIKYINKYGYFYRLRKGSIIKSTARFDKINSVFILSQYMLQKLQAKSKNGLVTTEMLVTCANKIVDLIRGCESKISTEYLAKLTMHNEKILQDKKLLFECIALLYSSEENSALVKARYYLESFLCFFCGVYTDGMLQRVMDSQRSMKKILCRKMSQWPLKENRKVGIYGSGRNADVILSTYRMLYGDIKADYVYIDSRIESFSKRHLNRPILNVSDIKKYGINDVIIASVYYENDMYETLIESQEDINIYRVYDEDVVSLEGLMVGNPYHFYRKICDMPKTNRLFLIGTPEYQNIGDHLIVAAEMQFFKDFFADYHVIEITNSDYMLHKTNLKRLINDEDLLVVTGGGFLGSLWTEGHYDEVIDLIKGYPNNNIRIMPQSIFFHNNLVGKEYIKLTASLYREHRKLVICLREMYSYKRMKEILCDTSRIGLFPDIALYYQQHVAAISSERVGVFLRCDKESILTDEQKRYIQKVVKHKWTVEEFSMHYPTTILKEDRLDAIEEKINEIRNYKLVVTDALHCMIVCALIGVPCIAINNISYKLEGVYNWLSHKKNIVLYNHKEQKLEECMECVLKDAESGEDGIFLDEQWQKLAVFLCVNNEMK